MPVGNAATDAARAGVGDAGGFTMIVGPAGAFPPPPLLPPPPLGWRSSLPSSGLFSCGFTVDRITMILLSVSNQKGAPKEIANAVRIQPKKEWLACERIAFHSMVSGHARPCTA